jgi:tRNA A37 threonylcarbamoyladenosine synthetase subunit TsaC/SUA5/YrdC
MLFLLPTDTCYGLAGAFTREDYADIYRQKGRDFEKPLAFLVRNFDDMDTYIEITNDQKEFLRHYPYPWSFLGKRKQSFILPDFLDARYDLISLRVASQCINANFRDSIQYPLFLTSANLQGEKESQTLPEAKLVFP